MTPLRKLINRDQFPAWLNENGLTGNGVEIGTYRGEYAEHLLTHWNGARLMCVDPWASLPAEEYLDGCVLDFAVMEPLDMDAVMAEAQRRIEPFGARAGLFIGRSSEYARRYQTPLDFAYLDGNHDYAHVAEDIELLWPKIKSGGVLGGHDFYTRDDHLQRADVANAVWDFSNKIGMRPHVTGCTSWWLIKP